MASIIKIFSIRKKSFSYAEFITSYFSWFDLIDISQAQIPTSTDLQFLHFLEDFQGIFFDNHSSDNISAVHFIGSLKSLQEIETSQESQKSDSDSQISTVKE